MCKLQSLQSKELLVTLFAADFCFVCGDFLPQEVCRSFFASKYVNILSCHCTQHMQVTPKDASWLVNHQKAHNWYTTASVTNTKMWLSRRFSLLLVIWFARTLHQQREPHYLTHIEFEGYSMVLSCRLECLHWNQDVILCGSCQNTVHAKKNTFNFQLIPTHFISFQLISFHSISVPAYSYPILEWNGKETEWMQ